MHGNKNRGLDKASATKYRTGVLVNRFVPRGGDLRAWVFIVVYIFNAIVKQSSTTHRDAMYLKT